jgi:uncharacterized protein YkwD
LTRTLPIMIAVAPLCVLSAGLFPLQSQSEKENEDETIVLKPLAEPYNPEHVPDLAEATRRLAAMIDKLRLQERIPIVKTNARLDKAARYFAEYMARTSRYGHKADDNTPDSRAQKFRYEYCIVAENIAYEFSSVGVTTDELARKFYEGWKASPGHFKNMVDPDVVETGLAIALSESGYFFAVQMFGRPASMSVEFEIANQAEKTVQYQMGDKTFDLEPRVTRTHQACRLSDLAFHWPDADDKERLVQPNNGDRFVVTQEGDALRLRREK